MKTRNGFVSNSSSSSFIIALPHKPKNADDVLEMFFKGKDYKITGYSDDDFATTKDISKRIFDDISKGKPASIIKMADTLSPQYYFDHWADVPLKRFQESFKTNGRHHSKYFGINHIDLYELAVFEATRAMYEDYFREKEKQLLTKYGVLQPPYGSELDIVKNYEKKRNNFYNNLPQEMIQFNKERSKDHQYHWKKYLQLKRKVAVGDVKRFMLDNDGKVFYVLNYGDENGSFESIIEHQGIFNTISHIAISNH